MEWVEITGKTVEEAQEKALDMLGVTEEDAEVEVLAEPKMGLFGRLREEARVRARVQPDVPRPKDDRQRKRRARPEVAQGAGSPAPQGPDPAAADAAGNGTIATEEEAGMEATVPEGGTDVPVAEQAEVAKRFVDGLLSIMGLGGASTSVVLLEENTAELQITGDDLGLLIGPKGATLLALQDLARTVVQRQTGARTGRLLLDVGGYRQKRKDALERFTKKVAADVVASGSPAALEAMSSADRKIVHDTANAIDGVTTTSEGEEPRRHVVVHPA